MTIKSRLTHIMMCGMLACSSFAAQSQSGAAPSFPRPAQVDVVKAQGVYALSQLKALAAIYGADPSGAASREAMDNGWAPVSRSYASPQHGWPARGPSLGESIEPSGIGVKSVGARSCLGDQRIEFARDVVASHRIGVGGNDSRRK